MYSILRVDFQMVSFEDVKILFKSQDISGVEIRKENSLLVSRLEASEFSQQGSFSSSKLRRIDILESFESQETSKKFLVLTILWPQRTHKKAMLCLKLSINVPIGFKTPEKEFLANLLMIYYWKNPGEGNFPVINVDKSVTKPESDHLLVLTDGQYFGNEWFSESTLVYFDTVSDFLIWAFTEIKKVANGLIEASSVRDTDDVIQFEFFFQLFMAYWQTINDDTLPALKNFTDSL